MSDIKVVISSDNKYITKFQNVGLNGQDGDITTSNIGTKLFSLTIKSSLVNNDRILVADSESDYAGKKVTLSVLKSFVLNTPTIEGLMTLNSGQIKFPSTKNPSADANTLDDYEEGSFTPTIEGTTSSGVGTYSTQSGRYIKIGRLIQVEILLNWSAHTGTGSLRIAGLPFTSFSNAVASIFNANVALTANNIMVGFTNGLTIAINQIPVGGGGNTSVAMDTAGLIYVNVTYMTT